MAVNLNDKALSHARGLVRDGKVVRDERDSWSEHAPSADEENRYIEREGFGEYARWYLGTDASEGDDTKGRYSFPFGDFHRVHRCAVISLESRAAQFGHSDIEKAAKELLELIDRKS